MKFESTLTNEIERELFLNQLKGCTIVVDYKTMKKIQQRSVRYKNLTLYISLEFSLFINRHFKLDHDRYVHDYRPGDNLDPLLQIVVQKCNTFEAIRFKTCNIS